MIYLSVYFAIGIFFGFLWKSKDEYTTTGWHFVNFVISVIGWMPLLAFRLVAGMGLY